MSFFILIIAATMTVSAIKSNDEETTTTTTTTTTITTEYDYDDYYYPTYSNIVVVPEKIRGLYYYYSDKPIIKSTAELLAALVALSVTAASLMYLDSLFPYSYRQVYCRPVYFSNLPRGVTTYRTTHRMVTTRN